MARKTKAVRFPSIISGQAKNPLILSFLALLIFLSGIVAERYFNPASPVNIPEKSLIVLDPSKTIKAEVLRASDGDTIVLVGGEKVRYLGIDAPELDSKWLGWEEEGKYLALEFNKNMAEGKTVTLEFEPKGHHRDFFGRLLAYVWIEGKMVNLELAKEGLAELDEKYLRNDYKYEAEFREALKYAQEREVGMWEK